MNKISADQFISQLYRDSAMISLADFPTWALNMLKGVIDFDGAIWGTGHISTQEFHTQSSIGISSDIFRQLKQHLSINPIFEQLVKFPGQAVDMRDVINDDEFYHSPLYHQCFKPFSVERILSSVHVDQDSGIFTLLTLYRFDRQKCFTAQEKASQNQLLFHLLSATSHRQIIALTESELQNPKDKKQHLVKAICDCEGMYHSVSPQFIKILRNNLPEHPVQYFPFTPLKQGDNFAKNNLQFTIEQKGDLFVIAVRIKNQLDLLSKRELQVVAGICQGNTFKEVARELTLSPSTVSNHLYRIYEKLNIHTRSELIAIASSAEFNTNTG